MTSNIHNCILFSSWVPIHSIELGEYYISTLLKYKLKNDLIVGVNSTSCDKWIYLLESANIKFKIYNGPDINSDVAGFMAALDVLYNQQYEYGSVIFCHSKGTSHKIIDNSLAYRKYLECNFWSKLNLITNITSTGGCAFLDPIENNNVNIDRILNNLYPFKTPAPNWMAGNTFYVMDYKSIHTFLSYCFNSIMDTIMTMEDKRYFFEAYFCMISAKLGNPIHFIKNLI